MKIYLLLAALLFSAAGAGWGGYRLGHAAADRAAAAQARATVQHWEKSNAQLVAEVNARDAQLHAQAAMQAQLTAGWLRQNRTLADRESALQLELSHEHLHPGPACKPVTPDFQRLYDSAARGGAPAVPSSAQAAPRSGGVQRR